MLIHNLPTTHPDCRIAVLPDLLVRKIAAGEVVERPASVVKELIENAIDAGATQVHVRVHEGGRQLIRVTDNGCGMSAQELALAVAPHATSKLRTEDDLHRIGTLGFRGEALASVSAVARVRIVSRREGDEAGHELRVAAQQIQSALAAGCSVGTTVEVRDLFFNVPARRKFLRTTATEMGHVHEQVTRVTLAHTHIGFALASESRVTVNVPPAASVLDRVGKFYGQELAASLIPVQRSERGLHISAFVAPPAQSRATAQWQYTFVNGRFVRDRFIQHAVREAYRGLIDPHRHPVFFLFLTLDPAEVDVNVHPTKIEVRWADAGLIHSQVLSALRETFHRRDLTPVLQTGRPALPAGEADQEKIRQEMAAWFKSAPPVQPGGEKTEEPRPGTGEPYPAPQGGRLPAGPAGPATDPLASWRALYGAARHDASEVRQLADAEVPGPAAAPRAVQMHNLYLVAETEDGILIVDQHALHERILYEQLRQRVSHGPLESQRLLLAETLPVTPQEQALLEEHGPLLERLGIEVTPFGAGTLAVQTFPGLLKDSDVGAFMRDLLDFLGDKAAGVAPDELLDRVLSMVACKAAVKAGDPLAPEEIQALFVRKDLIDKPSNCPHGRPTMLRLTKAELDRQFQRR